MNHLYQSPDGSIHECEGEEIANGKDTYVVWTKCGLIDVPSNKSFRSEEAVTCPECFQV